jgi:hypothetical protein
METERPGATMTARLYEPRHLLGPHGYARSDRLHGIGLGHLVVGAGFDAAVLPICLGWEERWYPRDRGVRSRRPTASALPVASLEVGEEGRQQQAGDRPEHEREGDLHGWPPAGCG